MEYTLMHKYIPVVDLSIDETGYIAKLREDHDLRHLPVGIGIGKAGIDRKALNDWWIGRSIPASRAGLDEALQRIGIASPTFLLEKSYGLSLSDQYWIRPKGSSLSWGDINFFQNDFSRDMGNVLFGHEPPDPDRISLMSPDNTSDGWLQKKWVIVDGKRILMKGGSGVYKQEPFNEVVASALMERLDIRHVDYSLTMDDNAPYSLCENFITPDTELIPAWRILHTLKQPNDRSLRDHFYACCDALKIPNVRDALGQMLTVDYILANEDRHWNNFGCIRNAENLEWIGFAPVFDSGTSLWYNTQRVGSHVESKPFRKKHEEQIKLVEDLSWYDAQALSGLKEEIIEIFAFSQEVDDIRRASIAWAVMERAEQVERIQGERKPSIHDALKENKRKLDGSTRVSINEKSEPER